MQPLLDFITTNLPAISAHWVLFGLAFVVAFIASIPVMRWYYSREIKSLNHEINIRDVFIQEYRERLGIAPAATDTSYSRLSNRELKSKTLKLVNDMRSFSLNANASMMDLMLAQQQAVAKAAPDQKDAIWHQHSSKTMQHFIELQSYFEGKYQTEARLLGNEILSRLPEGSCDEIITHIRENFSSALSLGTVVDDLESLAKKLPETKAA